MLICVYIYKLPLPDYLQEGWQNRIFFSVGAYLFILTGVGKSRRKVGFPPI